MGRLRVQSLPCRLVNTLATLLTMPRTAYLQGTPLSLQSQGFLASRANLEINSSSTVLRRTLVGVSPTGTRAGAKGALIGIVIREMSQARVFGSGLSYAQTFLLPHNR
ncbi:hypothetical protein EDB84DRAFT_1537093 [Lactarius hengduanensis]|nr:hypothetical protein EDB84DRAFT_1537093 [Lactarius hengduanensis]